MVGTCSTSSSSSLSSLDDVSIKSNTNIKFLCSYGGKILPRYPDGKLRYVGGHTRILSLDKSTPYSEFQAKLKELCGWESAGSVRCQLPADDLDALVSVTSDEDLINLVEEYDIRNRDIQNPLKIRTFLFPPPPPSLKPNSAATSPRTKPYALPATTPFLAKCASNCERATRAGATSRHRQRPEQQQHASTSMHNANHWQ